MPWPNLSLPVHPWGTLSVKQPYIATFHVHIPGPPRSPPVTFSLFPGHYLSIQGVPSPLLAPPPSSMPKPRYYSYSVGPPSTVLTWGLCLGASRLGVVRARRGALKFPLKVPIQ